MNFSGITARRKVAGAVVGSLLGGVAAATIAAPSAAAAPQGCSVGEVADTVSATWSSARAVPEQPPGANQVVMGALKETSRVRRRSPTCAGTSPPIRASTTT